MQVDQCVLSVYNKTKQLAFFYFKTTSTIHLQTHNDLK